MEARVKKSEDLTSSQVGLNDLPNNPCQCPDPKKAMMFGSLTLEDVYWVNDFQIGKKVLLKPALVCLSCGNRILSGQAIVDLDREVIRGVQ